MSSLTSTVPRCEPPLDEVRHGTTRWKAGLIGLLIAVLFGQVLFDMARDWWTVPALTQGLLLPPLAMYIAWQSRARILARPRMPDRRGLVLLGCGCALFLVGKLASEFFLTRFAFVVVLTGVVWTFWGIPRLRALSLPLLLLAAMVPLPAIVYNSLAAPLQLFASDVATNLAQALGISAFRDGNIIQLAGTSLGVAEACSGLNSLSALVVGSLVIGFLFCTGSLSRTLLCLASIPLAIAVNVLRVAGTAVLADYDQAFAMGFYHLFSGWLVFILGAGSMYLLASLLHRTMDQNR
jgi:exosortase